MITWFDCLVSRTIPSYEPGITPGTDDCWGLPLSEERRGIAADAGRELAVSPAHHLHSGCCRRPNVERGKAPPIGGGGPINLMDDRSWRFQRLT